MNLEDVLKAYLNIPELSDFKNVLFVGPHPDDIEFGCGGLISKLKEKNATIHFIIVTDGAAGSSDINVTAEEVKNTRYSETLDAGKYLNIDTIDFLDLEDGGPFTCEDVIKKLTPYVLKYNPEIVFAPDFRLKTECHHDHLVVGEAVSNLLQIIGYKEALRRHGMDVNGISYFPRNIFLGLYFTDDPNIYTEISEKNLNDKIIALKLHKSQFMGPESELLIQYFMLKAMDDGKKCDKALAESFKVLHPIQQHVYSSGYIK